MPRPVWEGHLRLSLVTCPIALHKATQDGGGVHFHLLHPVSHNRVKQAWKDPELGEIPRGELLHGYEIERGKYVIVEDEEIKSVRLESTKTIQIEQFVDAEQIDRLYWDQPYFMVPSGKKDLQDPFAVIRDAMAGEGQVALGRVVMGGRERVVAIEVRGRGMLLTTLHAAEEVRSDRDLFDGIADAKADPQMVDIAKAIIAKQEGPFEPEKFHDRYAEALRALVEAKAGNAVVPAAAPDAAPSNVVDLMEALRRSLKGTGAANDDPQEKPKRAAAAKAPVARKTAPSRKRA